MTIPAISSLSCSSPNNVNPWCNSSSLIELAFAVATFNVVFLHSSIKSASTFLAIATACCVAAFSTWFPNAVCDSIS